MKHFDSIISLGYFCSVALELERLGMRSTSSPFDWSISSFEGVIAAIGNRFDGFLDYDLLLQSTTDRKHYFNSRLGIWFYHDFDEYHSLKKQLGAVADKYRRRIDRFYEDISRPTLFIRYISDEVIDQDGKSEELAYIEHHYEEIVSLLRSFNEKNEIIFLANTGVESDSIHIYPVCPDENDTVARRPFEKNGELYDFLMSIIVTAPTICACTTRSKNGQNARWRRFSGNLKYFSGRFFLAPISTRNRSDDLG